MNGSVLNENYKSGFQIEGNASHALIYLLIAHHKTTTLFLEDFHFFR